MKKWLTISMLVFSMIIACACGSSTADKEDTIEKSTTEAEPVIQQDPISEFEKYIREKGEVRDDDICKGAALTERFYSKGDETRVVEICKERVKSTLSKDTDGKQTEVQEGKELAEAQEGETNICEFAFCDEVSEDHKIKFILKMYDEYYGETTGFLEFDGITGAYSMDIPTTHTMNGESKSITTTVSGRLDITTYHDGDIVIPDQITRSEVVEGGDYSDIDKSINDSNYPGFLIHFAGLKLDEFFKEYKLDLTKEDMGFISYDLEGSTEPNTEAATTSEKEYETEPSDTSFTNKFGTPTTKCAHSGCNNYIASSGDTNCCTTHSNKCAECGKYIDEDAMYCMDCLSGSIDNNKTNSSSGSSSGAGGPGKCKYTENGEYICNKPAEYGDLCKEHYEYLDNVYNSLAGD